MEPIPAKEKLSLYCSSLHFLFPLYFSGFNKLLREHLHNAHGLKAHNSDNGKKRKKDPSFKDVMFSVFC